MTKLKRLIESPEEGWTLSAGGYVAERYTDDGVHLRISLQYYNGMLRWYASIRENTVEPDLGAFEAPEEAVACCEIELARRV
jgi:hypothetical protein